MRAIIAIVLSVMSYGELSVGLQAQGFDFNFDFRNSGRGDRFSQREFDFWTNKNLIREAMNASEAPHYRFAYASYKLRAVLLDLRTLPNSSERRMVEEALQLSVDKLSDYRLRRSEVADLVRDCGNKALMLLDQIERGRGGYGSDRGDDLQSFLRRMNRVENLITRDSRFARREALDLLSELEDDLRDLRRDRYVDAALHAVRVIEEKVRDSNLRYTELLDVVRDCARVFEENLREAECFDEDPYYDRPNIDYSRGERVYLGRTRLFSRSRYERRDVELERRGESVRALRITAKDASVSIQTVRVEFANGREQVFYNISLWENQSTFVDLSGNRRQIERIEVIAASTALFGTEGRVEVHGIK